MYTMEYCLAIRKGNSFISTYGTGGYLQENKSDAAR